MYKNRIINLFSFLYLSSSEWNNDYILEKYNQIIKGQGNYIKNDDSEFGLVLDFIKSHKKESLFDLCKVALEFEKNVAPIKRIPSKISIGIHKNLIEYAQHITNLHAREINLLGLLSD